MRFLWMLVGIAIIKTALWAFFEANGSIHHPSDGVYARGPIQENLRHPQILKHNSYVLELVARYDIEARLIKKSRYWIANGITFSKYDYFLGWNRMSYPKVYEPLHVSHLNRFAGYSWGAEGPPIPTSEITLSSSNNHLIPKTAWMAEKISRAKEGSIVHLSGYLVNVRDTSGSWRWDTSMIRDDNGAGACETILVEELVERGEESREKLSWLRSIAKQ